MARPRRPFSGMETIVPASEAWMQDVAPGSLGVRQRGRWDSSQHWTYRQVNSPLDPLTYLFVLDMVANIDPDIELRAAKAAEYLNQTRQQFIWDPVTVGKVLSDLFEHFEDVLGEKRGLLERGKDYRGHFFLIHRNPATAKVYFAAREELMALAQVEMAARLNRVKPDRLGSPLLEVAALRGEFNG